MINLNNNNSFNINSSFGYTGSKCTRLIYGQQPSNIDELISSPIDLSVVPESGSVTLSFRYAYRKRTSSDYEFLKVFISNDCGGEWAQRKTLGGNALSSQTSTSYWAPSSQADWKTVHMINVTSSYFAENFRMRFRFEGEGGNNFYLDDINLYEGSPSDEIIVGLNEVAQDIQMKVYPNPTDADIHVEFNLMQAQYFNAQIVDITGKVISSHQIHANDGQNLLILDTKSLSQGSYMIRLVGDSKSTSMPFYKF